jgi:hypothetical protein
VLLLKTFAAAVMTMLLLLLLSYCHTVIRSTTRCRPRPHLGAAAEDLCCCCHDQLPHPGGCIARLHKLLAHAQAAGWNRALETALQEQRQLCSTAVSTWRHFTHRLAAVTRRLK